MTDGLAVLHSTCSHCQANFSVELLDATGQLEDVAVNTIGVYDGSKGEGLTAGSYRLKIDADASWKITITQPRNQAQTPLPQTYTGKSDQIVGPFAAAGAVQIVAKNTGTSNFAVELIDADGQLQDVSFNEIGDFSGSTISQINSGSGPYFLNVTSDGTWSLMVSGP